MKKYNISSASATLYVEVDGTEKPFIMIHGGGGDADSYHIPEFFMDGKMIIRYDRRGHSRSTGASEPYCLDDQIMDIKSIMDALKIKKASFLASSSGGVIGLGFLNKYPEMVELMVVHEPTVGIADTGIAFSKVLRTFAEEYPRSSMEAMMNFAKNAGLLSQQNQPIEEEGKRFIERAYDNSDYFVLKEVAFLADVQLDFERLAKFKEKLILGVGEYSIDSLPYEAVKSICAYLDMSYEIFAGGHSGSMTHPVRFYQKLNSLLQETDFYK